MNFSINIFPSIIYLLRRRNVSAGKPLPNNEKTLRTMKAKRAVKRITFDHTVAYPARRLYISVPKLNENEVILPGSLALRFDVDIAGGHANNFLVKKVSRALVDNWLRSLQAPSCKTRLVTSSKNPLGTSLFQGKSETTWCLRESRVNT